MFYILSGSAWCPCPRSGAFDEMRDQSPPRVYVRALGGQAMHSALKAQVEHRGVHGMYDNFQ